MAIPIKHNGIYRFRNVKFPGTGSGRVLNAYGTSSLVNGRNVMLYTNTPSDDAQKWRAMYAGVNDKNGYTLYWLNCELGKRQDPFALDRFMGSLKNNADVYRSWESSAKDQLVYFTENGSTGQVRIRLYDGGYALTAVSDANGGNNLSSLTAAGNCYWAPYNPSDTAQLWTIETVSAGADPSANLATKFPASCYYNEAANNIYPNHVGECTWYCQGRFFEVNEVPYVGYGDAKTWKDCEFPDGVDCDTTNKKLRANSIAVFSGGTYGHVVFIESVSGENVTFSEANFINYDSEFAISNGQIEVPNSQLLYASDGYKFTTTADKFRTLHGNTLTAIIYPT